MEEHRQRRETEEEVAKDAHHQIKHALLGDPTPNSDGQIVEGKVGDLKVQKRAECTCGVEQAWQGS